MRPRFINGYAKKRWINFITVVVGLGAAVAALAVGSGSGGSTGPAPRCTSDVYSCSDWSACLLDGVQTRACTLTNDCEYVTDPKPAESQSCTPECTEDTWTCDEFGDCVAGEQTRTCTKTVDCEVADTPSPVTTQACEACTEDTWSCTDFGICGADGTQSRICSQAFDCPEIDTAQPAETQSCNPECAEDTYECTEFSDCDTYGNQQRPCNLTVDCPGVITAEPATEQRCENLQCDQAELYDRIFCRLNLAPAGIARELDIEYLPEGCRQWRGDQREACIEYYRDFNLCWSKPVGDPRFDCAKQVLNLEEGIAMQKSICKTSANPEACLTELRENVYYLITFRFYDLEQRAIAFAEEGVDLETTAELITRIVENKLAFFAVDSYEERRAVIQKMRDDWAAYVSKARPQLEQP